MFFLVLLGELLAVALSISVSGLEQMNWAELGLRSFLIQWVVLLSAAILCPLRPWLARTHPVIAGLSSYSLILVVTLTCSILGHYVLQRELPSYWSLIDTLVLAAILAGIVLRYLYIQQQLHNQQQAELRARIQALQSRIQPHFLFNSLNSIASLVNSKPQVAESMIEDLASLFRASLSEPGLILLEEELSLCKQYIAIEQQRLGDRLQVCWQLPETSQDLQSAQIPSLLLQPLVENAVHHGIQPLPQGGTVTVSLQLDSNNIALTITNPVAQNGSSHTGNQMALDNIEHRLQAHFGANILFRADAVDNQFTVSLRYPYTSKSQHNRSPPERL